MLEQDLQSLLDATAAAPELGPAGKMQVVIAHVAAAHGVTPERLLSQSDDLKGARDMVAWIGYHHLAQSFAVISAALLRPQVRMSNGINSVDRKFKVDGGFKILLRELCESCPLPYQEPSRPDSPSPPPPQISIAAIQQVVAQHFNIPPAEMVSARRARSVARPRQVAMYFAKQLTRQSLPEIGRRFAGRDHTTVMHAIARVASLAEEDPMMAHHITALQIYFATNMDRLAQREPAPVPPPLRFPPVLREGPAQS